jgi:hypothetical protein
MSRLSIFILGAAILLWAPAVASVRPVPPAVSPSASYLPILKGFDVHKKHQREGLGPCWRLAHKHGVPNELCRHKGGCKRLAQKYGFPKSECQ